MYKEPTTEANLNFIYFSLWTNPKGELDRIHEPSAAAAIHAHLDGDENLVEGVQIQSLNGAGSDAGADL